VDPKSILFNTIASVLEPFETRRRIVVFQPEKLTLRVKLPILELDFNVIANGSLASNQLRAVIDRDQDAGCFYGLQSKLVIRDSSNPLERSILVTYGTPVVRRRDNHVEGKQFMHTPFFLPLPPPLDILLTECFSYCAEAPVLYKVHHQPYITTTRYPCGACLSVLEGLLPRGNSILTAGSFDRQNWNRRSAGSSVVWCFKAMVTPWCASVVSAQLLQLFDAAKELGI